MEMNYPAYRREIQDLIAKHHPQLPGAMNRFGQLHTETMKAGVLDAKQKELIALGIAIAVRCDGCIASHVFQSLSMGATAPEIAETVGVAIVMGGGPSVVYGMQALEAVEQFQQEMDLQNVNHASTAAVAN